VKVLNYRPRIDAVGAAVFVVHDPPERIWTTMLRDLELPYPVLVDTEMTSYRAWGLGHAGRVRTYLSPTIILEYTKKILFEGERLAIGGEPTQLGGDFIVDASGRIAYAHPQRSVDDRPAAGLLVRELERAAARPGHDGGGGGGDVD
jgi:peroxiredoxin